MHVRGWLLRLSLPLWLLVWALWPGRNASAERSAPERPKAPRGQVELPLRLLSPAFEDRQSIPRRYTCEGEDVAPPLAWEGVPENTASFALIIDDPDAPDPAAPKMTWVHWVVFNIPALTRELPEGGKLPPGARQGLNDFGRTGYRGPCPPKGRHRYLHKLYALDRELRLERPTKDQLVEAMRPHVLAQAVLTGTYEKTTRRKGPPTARLRRH